MKKPTLLVPILFVYALCMTVWGNYQGTIDLKESFVFMGAMTLLLVILWFLYRKKEKFRAERELALREEEERRRLSR